MARPILIPDMCAVRHVTLTLSLATLLGHTSFRDIILLQSTLGKIRLTAPTYLSATDIFAWLAGFYGVKALLDVTRLIGTHITFQASNEVY